MLMARPFNVSTPRKDEKTGKTYWTKIGVAFPRDGGGFSIKLEALPLGAEMMIFPPDERDNRPKSDTNGNSDDVPY
jgi:hypothetical protein